jgi:YVTN family beta-propeller protein
VPRGVKISPDGKSYVVTLEFANAFIVLDDRYRVVKTVKTGESPYGVAFDRAGDRLFVAAARSKVLQVFDTRTWQPVKEVPTGNRCWHFSFTPDERQILVACGRSDEVVVIDATRLEPVARLPDKALPWGIVTFPKAMGSLDRPE